MSTNDFYAIMYQTYLANVVVKYPSLVLRNKKPSFVLSVQITVTVVSAWFYLCLKCQVSQL